MNKHHNGIDFLSLLGGLAMLIAGLYWFLSSVTVRTGFYGLRIGSFNVASGLVVVPFIIGIVVLFFNTKSIIGKLLVGGGILIILASVIAGTQFTFRPVSLYTYLLILVLIAGGAGFVARALWGGKKKK